MNPRKGLREATPRGPIGNGSGRGVAGRRGGNQGRRGGDGFLALNNSGNNGRRGLVDHLNQGRRVDHLGGIGRVDHLGRGFSNGGGGGFAFGLAIGGNRHRGHHDGHDSGFAVFADYYQPTYGGHSYVRPYDGYYGRYLPYHDRFGYGYNHHGYYGLSLYSAYATPYYGGGYGSVVYDAYVQPEPAEPTVIILEGSTTVYETPVYQAPAAPSAEEGIEEGVVYEQSTVPPTYAEPPLAAPLQPADTATEPGLPKEPTLVDMGNVAFNVGAYQDAIRYYTAAVMSDDADGYARLFYGLAQFALGDYGLATVAIRRALVLEPSLISEPIDLRSVYATPKTFDKHRDRLLEHTSANPADANAMFLLGYVYFATAEPENALAMFQSALALNKDDTITTQLRDTAVAIIASRPPPPSTPKPSSSTPPATAPEAGQPAP